MNMHHYHNVLMAFQNLKAAMERSDRYINNVIMSLCIYVVMRGICSHNVLCVSSHASVILRHWNSFMILCIIWNFVHCFEFFSACCQAKVKFPLVSISF